MLFSAVTALAALAFSQTTLASPVRFSPAARQASDPHKLDFRTFGVSGCFDENQGVYTLLQSDANECRQFVDPVGSLQLTDSLCTLTIYHDASCSGSPVVAPVGVCQNGAWQSYKMTC